MSDRWKAGFIQYFFDPLDPSPSNIFAWGLNPEGTVGNNTTINFSSPVQVGTNQSWVNIATNNSSLAINQEGQAWAWGRNGSGQLGINSTVNFSSPVQIGTLTTWSNCACGADNNYLLSTSGAIWSMGINNVGQLGDNSTVNRSSPVQVGALTNWIQITSKNASVLALKTDGTMWAWGWNQNGRLGDGTVVNRSSPVQIGALTTWAYVSGGDNTAGAVKTDGTLWNWGYSGSYSALIDATNYGSDTPKPLYTGGQWYDIASNCAGGGVTYFAAIANTVPAFSNTTNITVYSDLGDLFVPRDVFTEGNLFGWGTNIWGQLGTNDIIHRSTPTQTAIGGTNWKQVSGGVIRSNKESAAWNQSIIKSDGTL